MRAPRAGSGWSAAMWIAVILAIAVHLAFVLFLVFSVTWRNPKPEAVVVDLYAAPAPVESPEPPKAPPAPPPEPTKPEPPKPEPPKPEPPKPEPPKPQVEPPKAPPKVEPPPPPKPDIALKEKQAKAERERKEREKQEAEKREAEKRQQEKRLAEARERQAREAAALKAQAERERQAREADALKAQAERERQAQQRVAADATRAKADADYIRRIQSKIRGNVVVPPDLPGNPEAVFDVVQLPTGEIIDVQLVKSSSVRAYDEAVQRAIIKSSPLPRPDVPDLFRRNLRLKFRPLD